MKTLTPNHLKLTLDCIQHKMEELSKYILSKEKCYHNNGIFHSSILRTSCCTDKHIKSFMINIQEKFWEKSLLFISNEDTTDKKSTIILLNKVFTNTTLFFNIVTCISYVFLPAMHNLYAMHIRESHLM